MTALLLLTTTASLLLAGNAAVPCAAVHVSATGFEEAVTRRLTERVVSDLQSKGVVRCAQQPAEPTDACLAEVACARELVHGADARWLLWVDALRAGGQVQVSATLVGSDGRKSADGDELRRAEEILGGARLVPLAVLNALAHERQQDAASGAVVAPDGTSGPPAPPVAAPAAPPAMPEAATEAPAVQRSDETDAAGMSPLAVGGVVVLGAGVLAGALGGALALGQLRVIQSPSSTGDEKEDAAVAVPALGAVAVAGVAAAVVGGVLLWLGLSADGPGDT